jgi:hypothetical protein
MTLTTGIRADAVTVNASHATILPDGGILAHRIPAGFWAVKVRRRDGAWSAFAVPLHATPGDPFLIAVGDDQAAVTGVAIRWANSARTATMRPDRIVYAGPGNAIGERLNPGDTDSRWTALDTKEIR